eukprot:TRINITY_DN8591_c0_g2_i1.p1 TRINITY_DN8591_c0_g2~~TRINITY_DN8591_c0_g2_i1.p1  ORF type:complete len:268 (+),score=60.97 TRINITY_DN8591_c0_g2_i1:223-1026(+)
MTSSLDMSLDDLIKSNKQAGGRGGGGDGAAGRGAKLTARGSSGPARRQGNRAAARPAPYFTSKTTRRATDAVWTHDLFEDGGGRGAVPTVGIETGTKLYVSNLDYGVSNDDIKELFSEVGDLKRCSIHYDRSGRSKGTAEVVFARKTDAVAALKRYNNVQLDGKPMNIELIGTNLAAVATNAALNGTAVGARRGRTVVVTPGFARAAAAASLERKHIAGATNGTAPRRFGGRGRGRGRGGQRAPAAVKSAEDLDAELDTYHAEAMQS